jgi:hypothetical protein
MPEFSSASLIPFREANALIINNTFPFLDFYCDLVGFDIVDPKLSACPQNSIISKRNKVPRNLTQEVF